jgi:SpoVK/Ycf46/Vps4 family AAA+-type ATPase
MLDIDVWIDDAHRGLKEILDKGIVETFRGSTSETLRSTPCKTGPVSALLFGPPGTSKTEVVKAVAGELHWPVVAIDPSHFLQRSYQNIYLQAETIFKDIADLSGVVVLFDEMDALVQKRDPDEKASDTESQFLTTYMLPKLAALHDCRRVAFFMATNYQENFDEAIKRAGRFDLLLCLGPPPLEEKCNAIHAFYRLGKATAATTRAGERIVKYCRRNRRLRQQLDLYTFGEFKNLLLSIGDELTIDTAIDALGPAEFAARVTKDSHTATLRFDYVAPILQKYHVKSIQELAWISTDENLPKTTPRRSGHCTS